MKSMVLSAIAVVIALGAFAQGNVGIGIASPTERLHVDSAIKIGSAPWSSTSNNSSYLKFGDLNYVTIGENGADDRLEFLAREFLFKNSGGFGVNQGRVGININTTPAAFLEINATGGIPALKITDGNQAINKVLTSDATGVASWQLPYTANSGFLARTTSPTQTIFSGGGMYRVDFPTEDFDDGNNFNNTPGYYYFYAPTAGVYHFDVELFWQITSVGSPYFIIMAISTGFSDWQRTYTQVPANASSFITTQLHTNLKLNAGQVVALYTSQNSGVDQKINGGYSVFTGYRVY